MSIEESLEILEGCLIEPIMNPLHADCTKHRVIEVQTDVTPVRICGYGETFESAIIDAATQYKAGLRA